MKAIHRIICTARNYSKDQIHFRDVAVGKLFPEKHRQTILTTTTDTTVFETVVQMAKHNIGAVLVLSGKVDPQSEIPVSNMLGIFTERDYLNKVAVQGLSSKNIRVSQVMSSKIVSVNHQTPLHECMKIITELNLRHFPVIKVIGGVEYVDAVFSIKDIIKYIYNEQMQTKDYIDDVFGKL